MSYQEKLNLLSSLFLDKQSQSVIKKAQDKLCYTIGNFKIGEDTLIINLGSALHCPSARLGLCNLAHKKHGGNGKCYALKAERMYPASRLFRAVQYFQWQYFEPELIADYIFKEILRSQKLKNKAKHIKFIRLNEAGDFHSIDQVKKVDQVLRYINEFTDLYNLKPIKLYTYSHRSDLFLGDTGKGLLNSLCDNFTINGSNFIGPQ